MAAIRFRHLLLITLLLSAETISAASGEPPAELHQFDLLPVGTEIGLIVPNLKRTSHDLESSLEAIERSDVLFGGRPVDQARALLGLQAGVNETGAAIVAWTGIDPDTQPLFIIPVTSAEDFLETNFDRSPDADEPANAWIHATGETVYARPIERHVLLSRDAAAVASWAGDQEFGLRLENKFGERAWQLARRGDIVIYFRRPESKRELISRVRQAASAFVRLPPPQSIVTPQGEELTVLDFDPLGLIVHGFLAPEIKPNADDPATRRATIAAPMSRLPDEPYFLAASANLAANDFRQRLQAALGLQIDIPDWVSDVDAVQFVASPSVLGLQGGLMNEAILVLLCNDPRALRESIRQCVIEAAFSDDRISIQTAWEKEQRVIEGISVNAYEVNPTFTPDSFQQETLYRLLFGRGGWRGFVGATDDAVIVTFSQRPDVFIQFLRATAENESLANDAVIRSMRSWLPPEPDAEVFLGVGQWGKLINQFTTAFKDLIPPDAAIPRIDPATKPIAFGLRADDAVLTWSIVVPSDVLSIAVETVVDQGRRIDMEMTGQ